jgi:hypothetical protein
MRNSKPILFVHVPKSGGTSIVEMFRRIDSHGVHYSSDATISSSDFGKFDFIAGHFQADQFLEHLTGRYSFTFIRDPKDRAISLYRFWKSHKETYVKMNEERLWMCRLARDLDFRNFLVHEKVSREFDNSLVRIFCGSDALNGVSKVTAREFEIAQRNMQKLDFVGIFESFEMSCQNLFANLGIGVKEILFENNVEDRVSKGSTELEAVSKLKINELDSETFSHLSLFTDFDELLYAEYLLKSLSFSGE